MESIALQNLSRGQPIFKWLWNRFDSAVMMARPAKKDDFPWKYKRILVVPETGL